MISYRSQPMWCDKEDENINDDDDINYDIVHDNGAMPTEVQMDLEW